jgi:2-hydroxyacyl-CoA lyase 1
MIDDESAPTNYYRAFRDISPWIPKNAIIIGEGANTMDIGRTQMPNNSPRTRLDAGSFGTMGIGMGFVLAAAAVHPDRPIISVSGDSAIGFLRHGNGNRVPLQDAGEDRGAEQWRHRQRCRRARR